MNLPVTLAAGAALPWRANAHDAGLDLAVPETRTLVDGMCAVIDTGVAVAIPPSHVGLVTIRSSLGKKGLILLNAPGVIDAGYRGTLKLAVLPLLGPIRLAAGDRIAQLLIVPCALPDPQLVDVLPPSADGRDGGFGSTN